MMVWKMAGSWADLKAEMMVKWTAERKVAPKAVMKVVLMVVRKVG